MRDERVVTGGARVDETAFRSGAFCRRAISVAVRGNVAINGNNVARMKAGEPAGLGRTGVDSLRPAVRGGTVWARHS